MVCCPSLTLALVNSLTYKLGLPLDSLHNGGQSEYADSSAPLFNMYLRMAEEEDDKMAERWQKKADGILIFVSLQLH
jgi:hypothetical protein